MSCTPELLGVFCSKIVVREALRLPSLCCPCFPNLLHLLQRCCVCVCVLLRMYGYNTFEFLPVLVVWRDQSSQHCSCSVCEKLAGRALFFCAYFFAYCCFPEEGLQPGSWGRWALMASVLIAVSRKGEHEWKMVDEYSRLAASTVALMPHTLNILSSSPTPPVLLSWWEPARKCDQQAKVCGAAVGLGLQSILPTLLLEPLCSSWPHQ